MFGGVIFFRMIGVVPINNVRNTTDNWQPYVVRFLLVESRTFQKAGDE